jgi:hypothetical protein
VIFVALDKTSKALQNVLKVKRQLSDVQRPFKLQNQNWSYVPTHMPMTLYLEKAYLGHFSIDLNDFCSFTKHF